jgi:hypothetical protein
MNNIKLPEMVYIVFSLLEVMSTEHVKRAEVAMRMTDYPICAN